LSVLNGHVIVFFKNESTRVRVERRRGCGYYMLCSKVGHKRTFAIKTKDEDMAHTCARDLPTQSGWQRLLL
jgi:hypothetical protein